MRTLCTQLGLRDVSELDAVFSAFDTQPIAAASLAQVHRARLREENVDVAVKIQFPQLRSQFEGDMRSQYLLLVLADNLFENFDLRWMHDEITPNLRKELDFLVEMQNSRRTAENFRGQRQIHVPKVYDKYTTSSVLTMEWIDGVKITDIETIEGRWGFSMRKAANLAFNASAQQIFIHGFVNCDAVRVASNCV